MSFCWLCTLRRLATQSGEKYFVLFCLFMTSFFFVLLHFSLFICLSYINSLNCCLGCVGCKKEQKVTGKFWRVFSNNLFSEIIWVYEVWQLLFFSQFFSCLPGVFYGHKFILLYVILYCDSLSVYSCWMYIWWLPLLFVTKYSFISDRSLFIYLKLTLH